MTVYVDNGRLPLGRMRMAHMLADTLDELHAMARALGLRPEWFQANASTPHYDVCQAKRARAIDLGAVPVDGRGIVAVVRRLRKQREPVA
ncbi:MAG: DUF4031 domain-containing protein [Burkholderiales bacterium]